MKILVTGAAGMLGRDLVRPPRRAPRRDGAWTWRSTSPTRAPCGDCVREVAARGDPPPGRLDRRGRRRGARGGGRGGQRRRAAATSPPRPRRRAPRSWCPRPTTSSTGRRRARTPRTTRRRRSAPTAAPSWRASAPRSRHAPRARASRARRGSTARRAQLRRTRCWRLGRERDEVSVVDDQEGSPTWTRDLAPALEALLDRPPGVYHTAGGGSVTWAGLRRARSSRRPGIDCRVRADHDGRARPPRPAPHVLATRA